LGKSKLVFKQMLSGQFHICLKYISQESRSTQKTFYTPPPLTIKAVFKKLKALAMMSGNAVSQ